MLEAKIDKSLVAIHDINADIVGTGFLITKEFIVTCAHVLADAGFGPGDEVKLSYFSNDIVQNALVVDKYWRTPEQEDVAVIKLTDSAPENVFPVKLKKSKESTGNSFYSRGYPGIGDYMGIIASGKIEGITKKNNVDMVQLTSSHLQPGHSGAPVFDVKFEVVVGIVSEVYEPGSDTKNRDTAFAIPSDVLFSIIPDLTDKKSRK